MTRFVRVMGLAMLWLGVASGKVPGQPHAQRPESGPTPEQSAGQSPGAVRATKPCLDLEMVGPKLTFLDRQAVYTFKVTNSGAARAANATILDVIPRGWKFASASDDGHYDRSTRTVSWFLGDLDPQQTKEVRLDVIPVDPSNGSHRITVKATGDSKADGEVTMQAEYQAIRERSIPPIVLEVRDTRDPVEVGENATYVIRITNVRSKGERDIKLVCRIPDGMQFRHAHGPTRFRERGHEIVFDPLPRLEPRADVYYRITLKALKEGDVRFRTWITSRDYCEEPEVEEETTKIIRK